MIEAFGRFFKKLWGGETRDLPVVSNPYWTVHELENALDNLEVGNFQGAAMIVDAMWRDDKVVSATNKRIGGLLGLERLDRPGRSDGKGQKVTEQLTKDWSKMFPDSAIGELERWGLFTGVGVGENVWLKTENVWTPKLKVWNSQFVYWRWDTRSYWLQTMDGAKEITPGDGHWVLYTPFGYRNAFLRGLVRSLAGPWLLRKFTYRDWSRYSEVHGIPTVLAKVPTDADPQEKEEFVMDIAQRGNEPIIRLPQRDGTGAAFGFELAEAKADTWEAFEHLIDRCERSITESLLGQNLTTEAGKGGGSYAAARVHRQVEQDLIRFDATNLAECLREQSLMPWAEFNWGDRELAPHPEWQVEPETNDSQRAKGFSDLANSMKTWHDCGAPVDMRAVLEQFDVPTLDPKDVVVPPVGDPPKGPGGPVKPPVTDPTEPVAEPVDSDDEAEPSVQAQARVLPDIDMRQVVAQAHAIASLKARVPELRQ